MQKISTSIGPTNQPTDQPTNQQMEISSQRRRLKSFGPLRTNLYTSTHTHTHIAHLTHNFCLNIITQINL